MSVLLYHDGKQDLELIRETLAEDSRAVIMAESTAIAQASIEQGDIRAMLLAVTSLDDPRMDLARKFRQEGLYDGALLLLCRGRQSEDAYRLCLAGLFEDYVTIDPLYDTFRLRLAVHRAVTARRHQRSQEAIAVLNEDLASVRDAACEVSTNLGDDVTRVVDLVRQALRSVLPDRPPQAAAPVQDGSNLGGRALSEVAALRDRHVASLSEIEARLKGLEAGFRKAATSRSSDAGAPPRTVAAPPPTVAAAAAAPTLEEPQQQPAPTAWIAAAPDTVLLVDDDPTIHDVLSAIVEPLGYTLSWAMDPTEATARARAIRPRAVLLDVEMPVMSGLEVLEQIRGDPEIDRVPVILLTGRKDVHTVMTAKRLGVDGYLVKPLKRRDLETRLATLG